MILLSQTQNHHICLFRRLNGFTKQPVIVLLPGITVILRTVEQRIIVQQRTAFGKTNLIVPEGLLGRLTDGN